MASELICNLRLLQIFEKCRTLLLTLCSKAAQMKSKTGKILIISTTIFQFRTSKARRMLEKIIAQYLNAKKVSPITFFRIKCAFSLLLPHEFHVGYHKSSWRFKYSIYVIILIKSVSCYLPIMRRRIIGRYDIIFSSISLPLRKNMIIPLY